MIGEEIASGMTWEDLAQAISAVNWETIADIGISIGTLLVALIALRIAQAERASPHRAALYEELLRAHRELAEASVPFLNAMTAMLAVREANPDPKAPVGPGGKVLMDAAGEYARVARVWSHILPERTLRAGAGLWDTAIAVLGREAGVAEIKAAQNMLTRASRASLSVDPLTHASLELTGQRRFEEAIARIDVELEVARARGQAVRKHDEGQPPVAHEEPPGR